MNTSLIAGVIASIITLVFITLDSKLFDEKRSKFQYFRAMLLNGLSVGVSVYFLGSPSLTSIQSGGGNVTTINNLGESMLEGEPNF